MELRCVQATKENITWFTYFFKLLSTLGIMFYIHAMDVRQV